MDLASHALNVPRRPWCRLIETANESQRWRRAICKAGELVFLILPPFLTVGGSRLPGASSGRGVHTEPSQEARTADEERYWAIFMECLLFTTRRNG